MDLKTHSTAYIKAKCKKESGIDISEEEWTINGNAPAQWAGESLTGKIV